MALRSWPRQGWLSEMMVQLDLFDGDRRITRWPGDGPYSFEWGPYSDPVALYFDGVGSCASQVYRCGSCGVYHPLRHDGTLVKGC